MSIKIYTASNLVKGEIYNTCHYRKRWGIKLYSKPCTAWEESYVDNEAMVAGILQANDHFVYLEANKRKIGALKLLTKDGIIGWTTRIYPAFVKEAEVGEYDHYITSEEECDIIQTSPLNNFIADMKVKILKETKNTYTVETIPGLVCRLDKIYIQKLP